MGLEEIGLLYHKRLVNLLYILCGSGLRRCGKSCRLRWLNYLRPNIKHGEFSDDEDRIICTLFANIGSRWSIIAGQLPGRTDNDIKNYWNTKLKKKLLMSSLMLPNIPFSSSNHKFVRPSNNSNYQQHLLSPPPCSYSSPLPPTLRFCSNNNNYATLAAARSFTSEGISNVPTNLVNIESQDQVLGSMQNYQDKESPLIMFGGGGGDEQVASSGGYEQLMMFSDGGISDNSPQQEQIDVGHLSNCDQYMSNVLNQYNMSSDLEEIKQLISTNNLSCNSNLSFCVDEKEEKVLMYY
ncbi:uncharacterized protein LOC141711128 isoform X2 [Apium graveolens]|uniref:uncharacterized protein LOC141711128 isoform X2 n=1 Tax=Apium graveolens TaxID=4045 RepID=UPI003D7A9EAF